MPIKLPFAATTLCTWVIGCVCGLVPPAMAQQFVPDAAVFTIPLPKGWKLATVDQRDGVWQIMTIEKKGFGTSGAVTLRWAPGSLALDSVTMEAVSAFRRRSEIHDMRMGLGFFRDKLAFQAAFTVFPALPFAVDVRSFHACGMTFVYVINVAQEDARRRQEDLQEVESGLLCTE